MILKTITHINNRPVIIGVPMKSPEKCLDEIQNGEHEKYPYTLALTDFIDPEDAEDMLRALVEAYSDNRNHDLSVNSRSLALEILDAMHDRAEKMSQASVTPFDNDTNIADLKREM